jgi:hypothetical protein
MQSSNPWPEATVYMVDNRESEDKRWKMGGGEKKRDSAE